MAVNNAKNISKEWMNSVSIRNLKGILISSASVNQDISWTIPRNTLTLKTEKTYQSVMTVRNLLSIYREFITVDNVKKTSATLAILKDLIGVNKKELVKLNHKMECILCNQVILQPILTKMLQMLKLLFQIVLPEKCENKL